jgi:hypothetical protein
MRYALVIVLPFLLTGCGTMTGSAATNASACSVWQPISWSLRDTDRTITEVKVSNARREAFCKGSR